MTPQVINSLGGGQTYAHVLACEPNQFQKPGIHWPLARAWCKNLKKK